MATHRIGKIYVELDLDKSRYMKAQQTLVKESTTGAKVLEKNFKNLGTKSGATFDLMRNQAVQSFNAIKRSGRATADDLVRAEKAKAAKIRQINEQQYGRHETMLDKMKGHWKLYAAAVVASVGLALRYVIRKYAEFEVSLNRLGNVSDETLETMKAKILAIEPALGSMTELTRGYYQVLSAGVTGAAESMELLRVSAKVSKEATIEQADAVKGLAAVMGAYRNELKTATDAADLLYTVEKSGITTVGELTPLIGNLANMSRAVGLSANEMAGALAQVSTTGAGTSGSVTYLQSLLIALSKKFTLLPESIQKYGSSLEAVKALGFQGVLKEIWRATDGNSTALIKMLGRQEAFLALLQLSKNEFSDYAGRLEVMTDKAGAFDDAWKRFSLTLSAVWMEFKNTVGREAVLLGEELAPAIKIVIKDMTELLKLTRDLVSAVSSLNAWLKSYGVNMKKIGEYAEYANNPLGVMLRSLAAIEKSPFFGGGSAGGISGAGRGFDIPSKSPSGQKPFVLSDEIMAEAKARAVALAKAMKEQLKIMEEVAEQVRKQIKERKDLEQRLRDDIYKMDVKYRDNTEDEIRRVEKLRIAALEAERDKHAEVVKDKDLLNQWYGKRLALITAETTAKIDQAKLDQPGQMGQVDLSIFQQIANIFSSSGEMFKGEIDESGKIMMEATAHVAETLVELGELLEKETIAKAGWIAQIFQTITDIANLGNMILDVIPDMADALTSFVDRLSDWPKQTYKAIEGLGDSVIDFFDDLLGGVYNLVDEMGSWIGGGKHRKHIGGEMAVGFRGEEAYTDIYYSHARRVGLEGKLATESAMVEAANLVMEGYQEILNSMNSEVRKTFYENAQDISVSVFARASHGEALQRRFGIALENMVTELSEHLSVYLGEAVRAYGQSAIATINQMGLSGFLAPSADIFHQTTMLQKQLMNSADMSADELSELVKQIDNLAKAAKNITKTWKDIQHQMKVATGEASQLDQEMYQVNQMFDTWREQMEALGATQAILSDIEQNRAKAIERLMNVETRALEQIDKLLASLGATGEFAPVQSMEAYQVKYAGLQQDVLSAEGIAEIEAAVDAMTAFIPDYIKFMEGYGGDYAQLIQGIQAEMQTMRGIVDIMITTRASWNEITPLLEIWKAQGHASGGLATGLSLVGERGPEWVVPTYEPEKSRFLRDVGADPDAIGAAVARHIGGGGQNIKVDVHIDGQPIRDAVTTGLRGRDTELIQAVRRAA